MKNRLIALTVILFSIQISLFSQTITDEAMGQIKKIDSQIYNESRDLFISLPYDYMDTVKSYPVLYVLFPHSSFFRAKSAAWHLGGRDGVPELIIIGICNKDGWNEVFPFELKRRPTAGGGDKFLSYIKTEVIPFVESTYRTDTLRILAGFSNSAMFANYILTKESDLFQSFILSSPMLGWNNYFMLYKTAEYFNSEQDFNKTLYAIYSTDDYQYVTIPMPEFERILKTKAPDNFKWKIDILENAGHTPYIDMLNGIKYTFETLKRY